MNYTMVIEVILIHVRMDCETGGILNNLISFHCSISIVFLYTLVSQQHKYL